MRNIIEKLRVIFFIIPSFALMLLANPITVEKTIPQEIQTSDILKFVVNVDQRTIQVYLANGNSGTVSKAVFLNFWNSTMTESQRTVVRGFVTQLSALAMDVAQEKVTGDLMD